MPASMSAQTWKGRSEKAASIMEYGTFILTAATLVVAMINNNLSMKFFNICGILAIITLILKGRSTSINWKSFALPASILFIGILDLIWYKTFKVDNSPFKATYHNYINTVRVFIFGFFMVLLAASTKFKYKSSALLYLLYSVSFIILGYALFQKFSVGMNRIDFGIGSSTGAAYSIMLVGLISAVSILYTPKSHPLLFVLNAVVIFAALVMTQTRSSILIFPIICCLTIITYYLKDPKKLFLGIGGFLALMMVLGLVFSQSIASRYDAAVKDINLYQQGNGGTSLGARFAMYESGMTLFKEAPLKWRSADERAQEIAKMVVKNKTLSSAMVYINVHLHNEIIENASLKGIIGVISVICFYAALIFSAYYYRSMGLFAFSLAIIGTGLSDVLLWARSVPIIIICGLTLLLLFNKIRSSQ
ncbi:O-antigen ligase family protein [Kosakonia sp. SMBL-WEM22]|uniref:O-antigen ligase family protein n=1 Tax=Kosakonia sp. SMBL-WEM22 TaxID=2725560 RepID=UPI00165931B4|nr:O-antigen ligase family protein [Kosakonia sp. SMBL-WEM22]MDV5354618.1 O-antigen ligase family protein [Enterobacter asburiae]QNQ18396.1 O-antigen ligase family protein [Kosakonia sp. SMBL-WEM22]